jgi:hypothetical protein
LKSSNNTAKRVQIHDLSLPLEIWYNEKRKASLPGLFRAELKSFSREQHGLTHYEKEAICMANKDQKQKKELKAAPKSNKQKKEAARDKKAAKASKGTL